VMIMMDLMIIMKIEDNNGEGDGEGEGNGEDDGDDGNHAGAGEDAGGCLGALLGHHVGAFGNIGGLNHCVVLCVAHLNIQHVKTFLWLF